MSLLAMSRQRVTVVRAGGSDENQAIRATNAALGFQVDERWLTLTAPRSQAHGTRGGNVRNRHR